MAQSLSILSGSTSIARSGHSRPGRTPLHPGRFLESRFLRPAQISQDALARALGISRRRVNELVRGRRAFTPDTAVRLGRYFHTDPTLWMVMQSVWDVHQAWRKMAAVE
ncbi:HigA family addiction module antitoxin [Denitromonas ohlonensis]|uniref:HigA family addiction module antidote protein n=2 Tax=Denitromonas TaxID=139331 RepID=A0A557S617_9RHOO|nr:HigA family addiction module antitoxin [Denitromonas ohlonensis]TVO68770.1 HigA family addiction module antidote protein [Denitromonas ohlonensis]TVO72864.1 HigA family addiction module antidote protein [Denitromonas ohlonensis]